MRALRQLAIMKVCAQICWATEKPAKSIPVNWLHNKGLCCCLTLIFNAFSNAASVFAHACVLRRRGNVYYWCNEVNREGWERLTLRLQFGDYIWFLFCFHLFTVLGEVSLKKTVSSIRLYSDKTLVNWVCTNMNYLSNLLQIEKDNLTGPVDCRISVYHKCHFSGTCWKPLVKKRLTL